MHQKPIVSHSYEEIRAATLDIISGKVKPQVAATHFNHLLFGVCGIFAAREGYKAPTETNQSLISQNDRDTFQEVFWDLFRQGVITLGDGPNPTFPFYRITRFGKTLVAGGDKYFFHDVSSYAERLTRQVPTVHQTTLLYVKEALQAFFSGCILSSSVMVGVATEHSFQLLVESAVSSPTHGKTFAAVPEETTVLRQINKFKNILDNIQRKLPSEIKEDLDTNFAAILSVIRNFRNQSGHPTGHIIEREQAFINLQLFIPYCKKMYQVRDFIKK